MKKILLLIFIAFCSLIFYQIVLGRNGLLEGYRISMEKQRLLYYRSLLIQEQKELANYIKYLKENRQALPYLAARIGYFQREANFIRISIPDEIEEFKPSLSQIIDEDKLFKYLQQEDKELAAIEKRIKNLKLILSVIFYLFFGFFGILILFGIGQSANRNTRNR
jgi:hypothetical protein